MSIVIYIAVMAGVTYLIRMLPLALIRKEIKNKYIKSFLYYVPYVTLAVMTFPAIVEATEFALAGVLAFAVAMLLAYLGKSLLFVAVSACVTVFVTELIIKFII